MDDPDIELTRAGDRVGTITMLAGTVASAITVLGFQIVAGRSLGTEAFAPVGIIWTLSFILYTVLMIPVEQFITRRLVVAGGGRGALGGDRRQAVLILVGAWVLGVGFVALTLDQFFEGDPLYIVIAALLFATRSLLAVGRGFLAGRRRYTAYGGSLIAEGVALFLIAVVVAVAEPAATGYAIAMALAPLTILAFRPWSGDWGYADDVDSHTAGSFLVYLIIATAASQVIIAGAPVVVRAIGGGATAISIVFVTFTLFRGPVTSAYNLVARVLPDFTDLSVAGDDHALDQWRHRIAIGGLVLALIAGIIAFLIGPAIVSLLYGGDFAPSHLVAGLAGICIG